MMSTIPKMFEVISWGLYRQAIRLDHLYGKGIKPNDFLDDK